jgi:hypothetical protein
VFGGQLLLVQQPAVVSKITKDDRWTVKELADAKAQLFEGRSSDVPPFPMGM